MSDQTDAQKFLAEHPEILIGRDALDQARAKIDQGNSFTIVNKPISNVVLIQEYDADTRERLHAVALVDDAEALEYYRKYNQGGENGGGSGKCKNCGGSGPSHHLFEKAPPA